MSKLQEERIKLLESTFSNLEKQIKVLSDRHNRDVETIAKFKSGLIKLSAQLLIKRPYPDREASKTEMRMSIEKTCEDMRLLGIKAKKLSGEQG